MKNIYFLLLFLFLSCASATEEKDGGIRDKDIVLLTEEKVSNFVNVLPEILSFSEKYNSTLSQKEKEDPDANKKFFEAIRKSKKMQKIALNNNFNSIDELITVYKNVVIGYMSIKIDFTNFIVDISNYSKMIEDGLIRISNDFKENKIKEEELKEGVEKLNRDKLILSNVIIIKKYENQIDEISSKYN